MSVDSRQSDCDSVRIHWQTVSIQQMLSWKFLTKLFIKYLHMEGDDDNVNKGYSMR